MAPGLERVLRGLSGVDELGVGRDGCECDDLVGGRIVDGKRLRAGRGHELVVDEERQSRG